MDSSLLMRLFRSMLLIRRFEEKICDVYGRQDMKSPVHLYVGQEAIAAGVGIHVRHEDYLFTTHRSHAHCLVKGADIEALYAEFYGRETGCCKGMGGSMHPAFPHLNIMATSSIVGGGIPHGVGTALSSKLRNDDRVSFVFFGDGASEEGTFHESLNFAAMRNLPVVFICENNGYATVSPISQRQPNPDVFERAKGYGIPSEQVDGNDVVAMFEAAERAVEHVRAGKGPAFIEGVTYRWKEHVGPFEDWKRNARPKEELDLWKTRCPIEKAFSQLEKSGFTRAEYEVMTEDLDTQLMTAIENARKAPMPPVKQMDELLFTKENQ